MGHPWCACSRIPDLCSPPPHPTRELKLWVSSQGTSQQFASKATLPRVRCQSSSPVVQENQAWQWTESVGGPVRLQWYSKLVPRSTGCVCILSERLQTCWPRRGSHSVFPVNPSVYPTCCEMTDLNSCEEKAIFPRGLRPASLGMGPQANPPMQFSESLHQSRLGSDAPDKASGHPVP